MSYKQIPTVASEKRVQGLDTGDTAKDQQSFVWSLVQSGRKNAEGTDPNMSMARRLAAVPFVGKDMPSRASQFLHPNVVIGLTITAYCYEGIRMTDFITALQELRDMLNGE